MAQMDIADLTGATHFCLVLKVRCASQLHAVQHEKTQVSLCNIFAFLWPVILHTRGEEGGHTCDGA